MAEERRPEAGGPAFAEATAWRAEVRPRRIRPLADQKSEDTIAGFVVI